MAYVEVETAVERRRAVRPTRNRLRHKKGLTGPEADEAQVEWEAVAVRRMLRQVDPLARHALHSIYAYWQARRCGWDVFRSWWRKSGRKNPDGTPHLYEPEGSPVWLWWSAQTWRARAAVANEHKKRQSVQATPVGVKLDNPQFVMQIKDRS